MNIDQVERRRPRFALSAFRRPRAAALLLVPLACLALGVRLAPSRADDVAEHYALPITPPADQGDTGLCWVYATLSMLETNYMQKHPGKVVELSRAALQRDAIKDRFYRRIRGEPGSLGDGGLAVEALALIRANGLLEQDDFHRVVPSQPVILSIEQKLADESAREERRAALSEELNATLGAIPDSTHLGDRVVTPPDLAKAMLGGKRWAEFDLARDGVEGWGASQDPDAREDTLVRYVRLDRLIDLIHEFFEARRGGRRRHEGSRPPDLWRRLQ